MNVVVYLNNRYNYRVIPKVKYKFQFYNVDAHTYKDFSYQPSIFSQPFNVIQIIGRVIFGTITSMISLGITTLRFIMLKNSLRKVSKIIWIKMQKFKMPTFPATLHI